MIKIMLKKNYEEMRNTIENCKESIFEFERETIELQGKLKSLHELKNDIENENKKLADYNEELEASVKAYQSTSKSMSKQISCQSDEIEELKKEKHTLISSNGGLTKSNKDLKEKLELKDIKIKELEEKNKYYLDFIESHHIEKTPRQYEQRIKVVNPPKKVKKEGK